MILAQQLVDAKSRHRVLRADGLEASDGKIDAIGVTLANEVAQDLRRGKVDLDNTGCFQNHQPRLFWRRLQGIQNVAPEMIGVEERQRRLKSRDNDCGLAL